MKWIGSWGDSNGLYQYNPENQTIKHYLPDEKDTGTINSMHVPGVLEDPSGDIWAGAWTQQAGINRLNILTGRFRHYLNGVSILHLYRDSDGIIWVATGIGLYRFNKETDNFTPFFDPLSDFGKTIVNSIIEDDLKNLWIVTESVIIKLYPDRVRYFIYGRKYGIKPGSLAYGGIGKTSYGEILIGNPNGFYSFSSSEKDFESKPPQIIISDFLINNTPIFSGKGSPLEKPIGETSEINLHFNQNIFSFHCSVIDYHAPEANKCYTMLENFDNVWREVIGDKSVTFINVPPGKYFFRVKAYNIDGIQAEKKLQIIISPPWWKTWWAYSIYGLMLLTVAFFMNRYQKQRTITKERQKAQVIELAQAKEIEKAYSELKSTQAQLIQSEKMASLGELTAGIAHEIQNPLNFVNNFSDINRELLVEMKEELDQGNIPGAKGIADDVIVNEDKINHHGKKADSIVKSMLQHSRTSSNQKELYDINALADEYLRLSYHGLRAKDKTFNASMRTDFDESIGKINIIPQDIGRVLLNLYNNAFYAVGEKQKQNIQGYEPTLSVSTRKTNGKVEIRIKDNGNGIPPNVLDKIFQPFFTTKPTGQGTGLGLSLSYDVIKVHEGEIKVETREGEFTEFVIQLPISKSV